VYQPRILLIGETYLHNVKADKIDKPKERRRIKIVQLSHLSLSSLIDNYIVIHVKGELDYLYEIDQKTEVVQLLRQRYVPLRIHVLQDAYLYGCFRFKELQGKELRVVISDEIEFEASKGKRHVVKFVKDNTSTHTSYEKLDRRTLRVSVGTPEKR